MTTFSLCFTTFLKKLPKKS